MQKKDQLMVLIVEPGKPAYVKTIDHTLESLQAEVGGLIEPVYCFEDPVAILCNEEGKLKGLPRNRGLFDADGNLYDILQGTFLVIGIDESDFISLTEEQVKKYQAMYRKPIQWVVCGNGILMYEEDPPEEVSLKHEVPKDHVFYVYPHTFVYAVRHNEVEDFRRSMKINQKCATKIEQLIQEHYHVDRWSLSKDCIYPALRIFGYDRVSWVLVYYIQKHMLDGRISVDNKAWADSFPILASNFYDEQIYLNSHPGLVDLFTTLLRKKQAEVARLCADIMDHGTSHVPDFKDRIHEILTTNSAADLEGLILSGKLDPLYNYLQIYIDDCGKTQQEPAQAVQTAKEFLSRLARAIPVPGTVLKVTSSFGMDFAFCRITNKQPDEVKAILEEMLTGKEADGISIEDLEAQFNRTKYAVENIGCSEDYFSPNFPADLTFCWDTMRITDLRENQRSN